ncbi:(2Fe-2S)-binding protein [Coralloluteibacterium thermophilus]|uniref:Bacterioferritin-associated ferredoxin n=1 Tax=Coralloluteibacterium thermophilum TaxID=2707049 RepID=A0ABV9NJ23_9GAMM
MYVCICNGITDRDIRNAAADGCGSLAELTMRTGCAATCGSCAGHAADLLASAQAALRGASGGLRVIGLDLPVAA